MNCIDCKLIIQVWTHINSAFFLPLSLSLYLLMCICSLFMWVQPESTRKLYICLWVAFITSCVLPYKLMGFMMGETQTHNISGLGNPWFEYSTKAFIFVLCNRSFSLLGHSPLIIFAPCFQRVHNVFQAHVNSMSRFWSAISSVVVVVVFFFIIYTHRPLY